MSEKNSRATGDQNQAPKFTAPMAQDPETAARLAAAQEAMEAVKQQARTNPVLTPKETVIRGRSFVRYTRKQRTRKRQQQSAFLWHYSPGTLVFGRSGEWDLQDNSKDRGIPLVDETVQRITLGNFNDDDLLYIWVTDENDPDAFKVERNDNGYLQTNAADYFFDKGKAPKPGVKRKYDLLPAPELIDGKNALCIYLNKPTKEGTFSTTKKKKTGESAPTTKGPENKSTSPGATDSTDGAQAEEPKAE
ncbi:MAG: hypothetical protein K0R39_3874 [Symbiobacteriaceae bacterium]|jgi:hypothetical protein|nr:hypothetical protein [Symbiobacteriaceae bacterium]